MDPIYYDINQPPANLGALYIYFSSLITVLYQHFVLLY